MTDVSHAIQPKSDQLNAEDLIGISLTAKIVSVEVKQTTDQPISVFLDAHKRPWKPCKSMARIMAAVWGRESSKWIGHSVTLYNDPTVIWAGVQVGGIRISHITGIDKPQVFNLSISKGKRKGYTIEPLIAGKPAPQPAQKTTQTDDTAAQVDHYKKALEMSGSMDQLVAAWGKVPPEIKPHLVAAKDAQKATLSTPPPQPAATDPDIDNF